MILTAKNGMNEEIYHANTRRRHHASTKEVNKRVISRLQVFGIVLCTIIVFTLLVGRIYLKANIAELNIEINQINCDIHDAEVENTYLLAEKNSSLDLANIEAQAVALGLDYPTEDNIIKILVYDGNEESITISVS